MHCSWLEYPITRPFTLRYLSESLAIAGLFWTSLVTLVSVATVGYESVVVEASSFNDSSQLWYERLLPNSRWTPQGKVCEKSRINVNDGNQFAKAFC